MADSATNGKPTNGIISRQEKARLLAARAGQVTYHSTYDEEDPLIAKKDDDDEGKADEVSSPSQIVFCMISFSLTLTIIFLTLCTSMFSAQ
jgi:hypothetical protein